MIRSIAAILIFSFLFQELSYANPDLKPINFLKNPKIFSEIKIPFSVAVVEEAWNPDRNVIPREARSAESRDLDSSTSLRFARNDKRVIYLIQDAHTNESAQLNIVRTLDLILQKKLAQYIFLEAGTGNDSLSFLRQFGTREKRESVSKAFLKKGYIQGPDYLDITSDSAFTLWGVEDKALYFKGIELYRFLKEKREFSNLYLDKIARAVKTLKPTIYNPALLDFDSKKELFEKENISFAEYFEALLSQSERLGLSLDASYPFLASLKEIKELESRIDFSKANQEQRDAMASLSKEDQETLAEAASQNLLLFRLGSKEHAAEKGFYSVLESVIASHREAEAKQSERGNQIATPRPEEPRLPAGRQARNDNYPELFKYFTYLHESEKIDWEKLIAEKENLEVLIFASLAKTEDEKGLLKASEAEKTLRHLLNLKITSSESRELELHPENFDILKVTGFLNLKIMELAKNYEDAIFIEPEYAKAFEKAKEFYALTRERDKVFLKNMLQKMDETGQKKAVLVVGGYHTEGLKKLFKENNISYVSIVPRVLQETNMKRYEEILLNQRGHSERSEESHHDGEATQSQWAPQPAKQLTVLVDGARLSVVEMLRGELRSTQPVVTRSGAQRSDEAISPKGARLAAPGTLDGTAVIRFSHTYSATGGLGNHLQYLNRALLERNAMTIYQLYPVYPEPAAPNPPILRHPIGQGELIEVPVVLPSRSSDDYGRRKMIRKQRSVVKRVLSILLMGRLGPVRKLKNALLKPPLISLTRFLPLLGVEAEDRLRLIDAVKAAMDEIAPELGGRPTIFIQHSPFDYIAIAFDNIAGRHGFTRAAEYHGGANATYAETFRKLKRNARLGSVTLNGMRHILGEETVWLGNGIDTQFFDPARAEKGRFRKLMGIRDDEKLILVPARIELQKGQVEALEVLDLVRKMSGFVNFEIVFAGITDDRQYQDRVKSAAQILRLKDRVRFVGHLDQSVLRSAYRDADLVLLISWSEGIPRVILEAQAMGTPVVVTNVGGASQSLDPGKTGFLVSFNDLKAAAGKVHQLLTDDRLRAEFSANAREFILKDFTLDALAERHESFYRDLLGLPDRTGLNRSGARLADKFFKPLFYLDEREVSPPDSLIVKVGGKHYVRVDHQANEFIVQELSETTGESLSRSTYPIQTVVVGPTDSRSLHIHWDEENSRMRVINFDETTDYEIHIGPADIFLTDVRAANTVRIILRSIKSTSYLNVELELKVESEFGVNQTLREHLETAIKALYEHERSTAIRHLSAGRAEWNLIMDGMNEFQRALFPEAPADVPDLLAIKQTFDDVIQVLGGDVSGARLATIEDSLVFFPPSGFQFPGMGKDLYERYPFVRELYERINRRAREVLDDETFDVREISFNGKKEDFKQDHKTVATQLAIVAHQIALWEVLKRTYGSERVPKAVMGASRGATAAYYATGVFNLDQAVEFTIKSTQYLQQVSDALGRRRMALVTGLPRGDLENILKARNGHIVLFYHPTSFVISAEEQRVSAIEKAVKQKNGELRQVPLAVTGHDPAFINSDDAEVIAANQRCEEFLRTFFKGAGEPKLTLISAVSLGKRLETAADVLEDELIHSWTPIHLDDAFRNTHDQQGIKGLITLGLKEDWIGGSMKAAGVLKQETVTSSLNGLSEFEILSGALSSQGARLAATKQKKEKELLGPRREDNLKLISAAVKRLNRQRVEAIATRVADESGLTTDQVYQMPEWALEEAGVVKHAITNRVDDFTRTVNKIRKGRPVGEISFKEIADQMKEEVLPNTLSAWFIEQEGQEKKTASVLKDLRIKIKGPSRLELIRQVLKKWPKGSLTERELKAAVNEKEGGGMSDPSWSNWKTHHGINIKKESGTAGKKIIMAPVKSVPAPDKTSSRIRKQKAKAAEDAKKARSKSAWKKILAAAHSTQITANRIKDLLTKTLKNRARRIRDRLKKAERKLEDRIRQTVRKTVSFPRKAAQKVVRNAREVVLHQKGTNTPDLKAKQKAEDARRQRRSEAAAEKAQEEAERIAAKKRSEDAWDLIKSAEKSSDIPEKLIRDLANKRLEGYARKRKAELLRNEKDAAALEAKRKAEDAQRQKRSTSARRAIDKAKHSSKITDELIADLLDEALKESAVRKRQGLIAQETEAAAVKAREEEELARLARQQADLKQKAREAWTAIRAAKKSFEITDELISSLQIQKQKDSAVKKRRSLLDREQTALENSKKRKFGPLKAVLIVDYSGAELYSLQEEINKAFPRLKTVYLAHNADEAKAIFAAHEDRIGAIVSHYQLVPSSKFDNFTSDEKMRANSSTAIVESVRERSFVPIIVYLYSYGSVDVVRQVKRLYGTRAEVVDLTEDRSGMMPILRDINRNRFHPSGARLASDVEKAIRAYRQNQPSDPKRATAAFLKTIQPLADKHQPVTLAIVKLDLAGALGDPNLAHRPRAFQIGTLRQAILGASSAPDLKRVDFLNGLVLQLANELQRPTLPGTRNENPMPSVTSLITAQTPALSQNISRPNQASSDLAESVLAPKEKPAEFRMNASPSASEMRYFEELIGIQPRDIDSDFHHIIDYELYKSYQPVSRDRRAPADAPVKAGILRDLESKVRKAQELGLSEPQVRRLIQLAKTSRWYGIPAITYVGGERGLNASVLFYPREMTFGSKKVQCLFFSKEMLEGLPVSMASEWVFRSLATMLKWEVSLKQVAALYSENYPKSSGGSMTAVDGKYLTLEDRAREIISKLSIPKGIKKLLWLIHTYVYEMSEGKYYSRDSKGNVIFTQGFHQDGRVILREASMLSGKALKPVSQTVNGAWKERQAVSVAEVTQTLETLGVWENIMRYLNRRIKMAFMKGDFDEIAYFRGALRFYMTLRNKWILDLDDGQPAPPLPSWLAEEMADRENEEEASKAHLEWMKTRVNEIEIQLKSRLDPFRNFTKDNLINLIPDYGELDDMPALAAAKEIANELADIKQSIEYHRGSPAVAELITRIDEVAAYYGRTRQRMHDKAFPPENQKPGIGRISVPAMNHETQTASVSAVEVSEIASELERSEIYRDLLPLSFEAKEFELFSDIVKAALIFIDQGVDNKKAREILDRANRLSGGWFVRMRTKEFASLLELFVLFDREGIIERAMMNLNQRLADTAEKAQYEDFVRISRLIRALVYMQMAAQKTDKPKMSSSYTKAEDAIAERLKKTFTPRADEIRALVTEAERSLKNPGSRADFTKARQNISKLEIIRKGLPQEKPQAIGVEELWELVSVVPQLNRRYNRVFNQWNTAQKEDHHPNERRVSVHEMNEILGQVPQASGAWAPQRPQRPSAEASSGGRLAVDTSAIATLKFQTHARSSRALSSILLTAGLDFGQEIKVAYRIMNGDGTVDLEHFSFDEMGLMENTEKLKMGSKIVIHVESKQFKEETNRIIAHHLASAASLYQSESFLGGPARGLVKPLEKLNNKFISALKSSGVDLKPHQVVPNYEFWNHQADLLEDLENRTDARLASESQNQKSELIDLARSVKTYDNPQNKQLFYGAVRALGIQGGVAVDVGASSNDLAAQGLLDAGMDRVIQIDNSHQMENKNPDDPRLKKLKGDATHLPLADGSADVVIFNQSLFFIADYAADSLFGKELLKELVPYYGPRADQRAVLRPYTGFVMEQVFKEAYRVLKPGGWILVKPGNHMFDIRRLEGPVWTEYMAVSGFKDTEVLSDEGLALNESKMPDVWDRYPWLKDFLSSSKAAGATPVFITSRKLFSAPGVGTGARLGQFGVEQMPINMSNLLVTVNGERLPVNENQLAITDHRAPDTESVITFIAHVREIQRPTGKKQIAVAETLLTVNFQTTGALTIQGLGQAIEIKNYKAVLMGQSALTDNRSPITVLRVSVSMTDLQMALNQTYSALNSYIPEFKLSGPAVEELDLSIFDPEFFETLIAPLLVRELYLLHRTAPTLKVVLKGDQVMIRAVIKQSIEYFELKTNVQDFIHSDSSTLSAEYQNAPRVSIVPVLEDKAPDVRNNGSKYFYVRVMSKDQIPNLKGILRGALFEISAGEMLTTNPKFMDFIKFYELIHGSPITNVREFIQALKGNIHNSIILYNLGVPLLIRMDSVLQAYRLMTRMAEQSA